MDKANFYCYAAGKESESICSDINGEVSGVDWHLGSLDHKEFTQKINNADLVIIIANLNNFSEASNVEFMVKLAEKLKVPTLVYSLFPIKLISQVNEKRAWLAQLDNISKATVLIVLDGDLLGNCMNKATSLTQHYISEGVDHLSTKLIVAIRAVIDPVIRQDLIGVDFADYRLAFANKGFYQTKEYSYEALNQAEVNNDNWLQAKVIFVTIYLNRKDAIDVYSEVSTSVCNMLKESHARLLITPVIEGRVQNKAVITIIYN
ncbi:MAG: hypothetical protein V5789_02385 [Colwellia sp.]